MNYNRGAFTMMKRSWLPRLQDVQSEHITAGDLAKFLYRGLTYDHALPHEWVKTCQEKGIDPRGQCVWIYVHNMCGGEPAALTHEFFEAYRREFDVYPVCPKALRN